MLHARNDIQEKIRFGMCSMLQERLSDSLDLTSQARQAHWNVRGVNFISLHELFDKVYVQFGLYSDLLAERIVQLGGIANGTIRMASLKTTLPEYQAKVDIDKDHVAAISNVLSHLGTATRNAIDAANEIKDMVTADILTEITRGADMLLWLVEAHITESQRLVGLKSSV